MPEEKDRDLTIEEAARALGRSTRQVRRYVQTGQLPAHVARMPVQQAQEHLVVRLSDIRRLQRATDPDNV